MNIHMCQAHFYLHSGKNGLKVAKHARLYSLIRNYLAHEYFGSYLLLVRDCDLAVLASVRLFKAIPETCLNLSILIEKNDFLVRQVGDVESSRFVQGVEPVEDHDVPLVLG